MLGKRLTKNSAIVGKLGKKEKIAPGAILNCCSKKPQVLIAPGRIKVKSKNSLNA
ncbi:MAG: hypothetical protein Q7R70_06460 [Candidatus Diapherotrites archaeon]|nr:hypothetical protein [Candidatus Diapherotrites archaeon]